MNCRRISAWVVVAFSILLGLLVLFTRPVRYIDPRFPIPQPAQLKALSAGLELFRNEFGQYPPSDANDPLGFPYCGAMKLAEAVLGKDQMGFHPDSSFLRSGLDANGVALYGQPHMSPAELLQSREERRFGIYATLDNTNCHNLATPSLQESQTVL